LENEQAKLAREKQSSDQMCVALQKLFADKENEHQMQVKVLTERALDAEAQLDAGLSLQQELKRRVVELEEQVRELNDDKKERITKHQNAMEKMQDNLVKSSREKEALVDQISILQNQMETAQQNFIKERDKMLSEVEQRVHNAELKGEAMEVSRANEQLKAKEAVASYKKVVELHQTTVERMKSEAKDKRIELEKLINEEHCVSQVGQRVQFESLFDWTQF
jgi:chromosome segregation ATPase